VQDWSVAKQEKNLSPFIINYYITPRENTVIFSTSSLQLAEAGLPLIWKFRESMGVYLFAGHVGKWRHIVVDERVL